MQSVKLATLLAVPAILVGCGGSESSPYVAPKYTIDFVALAIKNANQIGNCEIYGQDSDQSASKYIVASRAIGQNITLYIHSKTGENIASYSGTDWTNGSFTFEQSEVPTDGYISLVATNTAGVHTGYDVLTIEKSLIPSRFTINAKGETSSGACITKSSRALPTTYTGFINDDGDPDNGLFAFNTTVENITSNSQNNIDYRSYTGQEVLAARFCRTGSSACEVGQLLKYSFVQAGSGSHIDNAIELTDVQDKDTTWQPNNDAVLTSAELNVYRSGTGALKWQALSTNTQGTYSYSSTIGNNYYLAIEGTHKQWDFSYSTNVSDAASGINESNVLTDLAMPNPNLTAKTLSSCSTSDHGSCVNGYTGSVADSMNFQRTLIAAANLTHSVSQAIYAPSKELQPLMTFNNGIDSIWGNTLNKVEISLFTNGSNPSLDSAFLSGFFNAYKVVDNDYSNESYTDTISVIETQNVRQDNENALAYNEYKIFNHNQ
ncbi:hypothetical protein VSVS12_00418 [Vibrio scophthalmi]|uniref:hypothetical protein n=1 Tax=Vibrio scophthalmi TaxID=45658 RepID=UPI00080991EF|nr:hypothetical protein [Vibrio scophthalmi]ANS84235.1 hypothetical protein VSVS12_00418 [Vibrio scophthalmi]